MGRITYKTLEVRKHEFDELVRWWGDAENIQAVREACRSLPKKERLYINVILNAIDTQPWPNAIPPVNGFVLEIYQSRRNDVYDPQGMPPLAPRTLRNLVSSLSACMRFASKRISMFGGKLMSIETNTTPVAVEVAGETLRCFPRWQGNSDDEEKPEAGPHPAHIAAAPIQRFQRIIVLGKHWETEFAAEFTRGMKEQAKALGIRLDDCRGKERIACVKDNGESTSMLKERVNSIRVNSQTDAVVIYYEYADLIQRDLVSLRHGVGGFWVLTVGYGDGDIRQDDVLLGKNLAEQCLNDEQRWREERPSVEVNSRIVILTEFAMQRANHEYVRWKHGIEAVLEAQPLLTMKTLPIEARWPSEACVETYGANLTELIKDLGQANIAAVFPRTEAFIQATCRLMAESFPNIRVYGERIFSGDLRILARPNSPLWAVGGVDPFHFGRYTVRAASCRWGDPTKLELAPPVIITRADAERHMIVSNSSIPENLKGCDVRLDGEKFAWADWMRTDLRR